jgi:hypothetical protein
MGASEWGEPPNALKGKRGRERIRRFLDQLIGENSNMNF